MCLHSYVILHKILIEYLFKHQQTHTHRSTHFLSTFLMENLFFKKKKRKKACLTFLSSISSKASRKSGGDQKEMLRHRSFSLQCCLLINFPDAFYQFANHHYCSHFDKHHINFYFQSNFLYQKKRRTTIRHLASSSFFLTYETFICLLLILRVVVVTKYFLTKLKRKMS